MQLMKFFLATLACLCMFAVSVEGGRITRRTQLSYYVDYSEIGSTFPLPAQTTNTPNPNFQDATQGGYLESFVYTRVVYDQPSIAAGRQNIGSATYNVVLDYKNANALFSDVCFSGTYTSIAQIATPDGGEFTVSFGGTIQYFCPTGPPGVNQFTTYVASGSTPLATSPVLASTNLVNIYPFGTGTLTQKWNNVGIWDRQAQNEGTYVNCNPDGLGGFTDGCTTEYALSFRRPATLSGPPPPGFPAEGV